MRYVQSRKYPITHAKKSEDAHDRILDLSVTTAVGLVVLVFAKGVFWGYMLKKWMH